MKEIFESDLSGYRRNEYLKDSKFSNSFNMCIFLGITIYVIVTHPWSPLVVILGMLLLAANIARIAIFNKCSICQKGLEKYYFKKESMGLIRYELNGNLENANAFICTNCKMYVLESDSAE